MMQVMRGGQGEHEEQRAQVSREELAERLTRALRTDGAIEPFGGLRLRRESTPTELGHGVSEPCFCVMTLRVGA